MTMPWYLVSVLTVCTVLSCRWLANRVVQSARSRRNEREFWARQNRAALARVLPSLETPADLRVIEDKRAFDTTVQVISIMRDQGGLLFIQETPGTKAEQLAEFLGFSSRQVDAALEVLLAAGIVERANGCYSLTRAARMYVCKDSPFVDESLPDPMVTRGAVKVFRSGTIPGSVAQWASGKSHSPSVWAMSMHQVCFPLGFALHNEGLLDGASNILDVAGGAGSVCVALALTAPERRLTLLELPGSLAFAKRLLKSYDVADRVTTLGMDMFSGDWPRNADAVLFTNIFHDWSDEQCLLLAEKAFSSLEPGGLIVLQEALFDDERDGPLWTAHFSMAMAMVMEGRQFRRRELLALLRRAGFVDARVHSLLGYYSAVVGVRPNHAA